MTINTGESPTPFCLIEAFSDGLTFKIDNIRYVKINDAITTLVSALEIDGLFQVFAQSFHRFEKDLLDIPFEYAYANKETNSHDDFFSNIRHRFNVNVITILTAFKSYDDQCNRILKSSINPPEAMEFNCKTRVQTFDAHLSYRICDQLRNYAQHQALPLGVYTIGSQANIGHDQAGQKVKLDDNYSVLPWLNAVQLQNASKCKCSLRQELEKLGYEKIDLKWLVRSFAGAMYERHAALRSFLKPKVEAAGEQIASSYDFASEAKGSEVKFLQLNGDGKRQHMKKDLSAEVLRAFETYASLERAERFYVSSRIEREAGTYSGDDVE